MNLFVKAVIVTVDVILDVGTGVQGIYVEEVIVRIRRVLVILLTLLLLRALVVLVVVVDKEKRTEGLYPRS